MPKSVLSNKTVLLTGAASGIGRCLAKELADAGAKLILVDRDEQGLRDTIELYQLQNSVIGTLVQDLLEDNAAELILDRAFGLAECIDVLYNNAGMMAMGPVKTLHWDDFTRMQTVNLNVPMQLTHLLLPKMIKQGGGYIAFTSSASAITTPPGAAGYGMTKAGITAFAEALRAEVHRYNINVTTICPGFVHTSLAANTEYRDEKCRERTTSVPLFVGSTPEKVARISVKAMLNGRGLVVIGGEEKFKSFVKRLSDRLFSLLNRGMGHILLEKD